MLCRRHEFGLEKNMTEKRKYWLHRITGGENGTILSVPLLRKHNLLSIGWSFLSKREIANDIQKNGLDAVVRAYKEKNANWSRNAFNLLYFIAQMSDGDIVLVPEGRYISLYQIVGNKILCNEDILQEFLNEVGVKRIKNKLIIDGGSVDLGFYRKVKPLAIDVLRSDLPVGLYRKTRTLQTNINISDVAPEIERLIHTASEKRDIKICETPYLKFIDNIKKSLDEVVEDESFEERLNNILSFLKSSLLNGIRFEYTPQYSKTQEINLYYDSVKEDIDNNIEIVKQVISSYLCGDIFTSIKLLNDWWDAHKDFGFPYAPVHKDYVYYRTRLKENNDKVIFEEKDLFHVPFNMRGAVTTKRYSLPGYPCLYLGRSIYVCWEEMRRPALSDFATSALKAQEDLFLLDLRLKKRMYSEENCITFLKMLPIILACSMRVANENDNFKPEYILPQLLLHIIIVKNQGDDLEEESENQKIKLGGIEYTSTAVNDDFDFINNESVTTFCLADCIVLPVKIVKDSKSKYCEELAKKFLISKPKYYENEHVKDSLGFVREYLSMLTIQDHKIDLSQKPFTKKYDASYFSYMERSWKDTDFKRIATTPNKSK